MFSIYRNIILIQMLGPATLGNKTANFLYSKDVFFLGGGGEGGVYPWKFNAAN